MKQPMIDFIKFKNQLLLDMGAKTQLVPDDQIEELSIDWDGFIHSMDTGNDTSMCPYCFLFIDIGCHGCPMYEKNNACLCETNTYKSVLSEIRLYNEDEEGSLFFWDIRKGNDLKDFVYIKILKRKG